jgi:tetratricopeptide (TPR) repeat protein
MPPVPSSPPSAPPLPNATGRGARADADLTNLLEHLKNIPASNQTAGKEESAHLTLARGYLDAGMQDEAIAALRMAARAPADRFEAASLLGRMYLQRDDLPHAIEWLERAAEALAPTDEQGRELLYDLGCVLETVGETARALAVFLELQADAGEYRDVTVRVDRLARVQAGG